MRNIDFVPYEKYLINSAIITGDIHKKLVGINTFFDLLMVLWCMLLMSTDISSM